QSGEGSSMSWERYKHLCDLMQLGNKAFRENRLDQLEKYELARDVICSGLQIDPQNNSLLNLDRSTANTFTRRNHIKPQRTDDYDCTLCLKLLYEPITTPCGHSFCRSCLFQSMDRGNRCPLCRTVLFISPRTSAISCEPLPDGRFFLEVESRRRCHIIRNWDQDGYRIAEVEWVEDSYPPEGAERDDLLDMTNKAAAFARQWIKDAQEAAQGDRIRLAELFKAEGMMPTTRDPERFSFWLATLTNRRPSERLDLLRIRDTKEVETLVPVNSQLIYNMFHAYQSITISCFSCFLDALQINLVGDLYEVIWRIRRALLYMKAEEQGYTWRLLWKMIDMKNAGAKVSWDVVLCPKEEGEMGLTFIPEWKKAIIMNIFIGSF
ncbi:UNVERIFIED_CONTAM: hypothetical protein Sindi_0425900, partial [Sesamum indicum]